ncbi:trypsin-1 [Asbolus verrucosus]|uniref:Trypsin-1 n=1 Tax=Asbolus verrucosus TaxID=1661398 RepID=A0A482VMW8_ASBVE|nr:trypsin-1 [Asbolus verrucosus]
MQYFGNFPECGVPNRKARFVGGEYLRGYEFPWLSLIQVQGKGEEEEGKKTVPGALINNKYVITEAAQLVGLTPYDVKVTLGQFDRCSFDVSSMNVSVDKIIIHPDFSPENKANDLALLKLSNPVIFERRISPICLSVPGHNYLGQVATIVGWPPNEAAEEEEATTSCRPKKLGLPVLDNIECLETAQDPTFISTDKGCVGLVGTPSVVCEDDAGTPVMYRSHAGVYELIGILTDQNQCEEDSKSTALYTKINDHLWWITKNTRDACYCFKT